MKLELTESFLSEMDSDKLKLALATRVRQGKKLSDEELMQYIILPLTYQGMGQKKAAIQDLFELSKQIAEEETQLFLLTGILVFTDKVIDEEVAEQIKE